MTLWINLQDYHLNIFVEYQFYESFGVYVYKRIICLVLSHLI